MSHSKKIVLLGHFGVGKTSLVRQFVESEFSEDYLVTVGVHIKKKELTLGDEKISLIIWDIEGNTAIEKARNSYLLGSHGFVYVFDITRPETYEELSSELQYLDKHHQNVPYCVVGNKSDLFDEELNPQFFEKMGITNCFFTSAKTGDSVEAMFTELAEKLI